MTVREDDAVPPVSNSEIQTWISCRRRWYLTFYRELGLKRAQEPLVGALELGKRIHIALDRKYTNGEHPLDVIEELHAEALSTLDGRERDYGYTEYETRDKLQKERELAHAMLEGFEAWLEEVGLDENLEIVGAETVVEVASGVPGVRLRGKLDQRIHREIDGVRLFRDWKTAANLIDGPRTLPIDEQTKFYMLLERLDALAKTDDDSPEPTTGGLYTMLRKVKRTGNAQPPFYDQVEVHHNRAAIESMWIRTHKRLNEMLEARRELDAGGDHRYWVYPHPQYDCHRKCPFFAICPMMDDGSNWEGILAEHYEHRDPYERYDVSEPNVLGD